MLIFMAFLAYRHQPLDRLFANVTSSVPLLVDLRGLIATEGHISSCPVEHDVPLSFPKHLI